MKPSIGRRIATVVVAFLASVAVYAIALHFGWLSPLTIAVYDLAMEYRVGNTVSEQVVVAAIDRGSLDHVFPQPGYPISRHLGLHATAVARLDSAGARLIAFDLLFDRLNGVADTLIERFAGVIAGTDKVILASSIEQRTEEEGPSSTVTEQVLCRPVAPLLTSCRGVALIDMPVDKDGTIRRCYFGKKFHGSIYPTIEGLISSLVDSNGAESLPEAGSFYIDYSLGHSGIPSVPYEELITGGNWQHLVHNKIVLIGLTGDGPVDKFKPPISRRAGRASSMMSGVEIHAHAVETLLRGARIETMNLTASLLLSGLALGCCVLAVLRFRVIFGVAFALAAIALVTLGGIALVVRYGVIFPVGAFNAALAILIPGAFALNLGFLRKSSESMSRELEGIDRDMNTAGAIQKNLQPVAFPESENLKISAAQQSYRQVGGDYYDVVALSDGRVGILVGDVSGKGVPGSLIMANLQGRFRQIAPDTGSPAKVLENLNELVNKAAGAAALFATLFYGIVDTRRRLLTFANAAHCRPIICSKAGRAQFLDEGGLMIGPFPGTQWDDCEVKLADGDILCLYSDGIAEMWDRQRKNMFGEERIAACIEEAAMESTESILSHILERCRKFSGGGGFDDDWTLLVARLREGSKEIQ